METPSVPSVNKMCKDVKINNEIITALIDTGSEVNVVQENIVKQIGLEPKKASDVILTGFGGTQILSTSAVRVSIMIDEEVYDVNLRVVPNDVMKVKLILGNEFLSEAEVSIRKDEVKIRRVDKSAYLLNIDTSVEEAKNLKYIENKNYREEIENLIKDYKPEKTKTLDLAMKITLTDETPIYNNIKRSDDGPLVPLGITLLNAALTAKKPDKKEVKHSVEKGAEYEEGHHEEDDHEKSKGYDEDHKFEKGEKEIHDKVEHKKEYKKESEKEKKKHDEEDDHGSHHHESESIKGGKFNEKKKYKKGSKTTGYHNVYHKDEYIKDHTFYDELDHRGKFKKYDRAHEIYEEESEKESKGKHHESEHEKDHKGHKEKHEKGHHDKHHEEYEKEHSGEDHDKKHKEHEKKGHESKKSHHGHHSHSHDKR